MRGVRRAEALLMRIIGVLLILLGLALFASPQITYTGRETVIHTPSADVTVKRQKTLAIPRPVAALVVGAGVLALILASKKPQQ
jgi:hypothetical protein